MVVECKEWVSLPTQARKTGFLAKQVLEANTRIKALEEELQKAHELIAIQSKTS